MERQAVSLSVSDAFQRYSQGAMLLDVRLQEERDIFGVVPRSQHLPLSFVQRFRGETPNPECEIFSKRDITPRELQMFVRWLLEHRGKNTQILCFCAHGNRSVAAASLLREIGYPEAYSVEGGMAAWQEHGFPVESPNESDDVNEDTLLHLAMA